MRNGSGKRCALCVESLEERNAPGALLPAGAEALPVMELPQGGGTAQAEGRKSGSLTLAIVTEANPMPVEVDRPGVIIPRPYSGDPVAIYFVVSYQVR